MNDHQQEPGSASETRIFTFSSGGNADRSKLVLCGCFAEAWRIRLTWYPAWLRRIACLTGGAYYETTTNSGSVRALVADSFRLLVPSSQLIAAWTPTLGFKSDLKNGLVMSASLAVVLPSGEFIGVLGLDFRITDLQRIVCTNCFAFVSPVRNFCFLFSVSIVDWRYCGEAVLLVSCDALRRCHHSPETRYWTWRV